MKKLIPIGLVTITILLHNCGNEQGKSTETNLPPAEFAEKIKELPAGQIIDVRTPEEFSRGHLQNASNIDWNEKDFNKQISSLDKSRPVFVYCLSGGRSSSAAHKMRSEGFEEVYELDGGMMKWRAANFPETAGDISRLSRMTKEQFNAQLDSDKLVLIDFYADWCAPCKRMEPYIKEISKDMADKVEVIRINADDNAALCEELRIDALPVLQLYKNKVLTWTNIGYIEKADIEKHLQ
ncbi:MAG: thioredoxin domain-containing protein [Chitinophagales bacterium]